MKTKIEHFYNVAKYGLPTVIKMKGVLYKGLLLKGIKIFHDSLPSKKTAYSILYDSEVSNFYLQKKDNSDNFFGTFVLGKRIPLGKDEVVKLESINSFKVSLRRREDPIRATSKELLMNKIAQLIKEKNCGDTLDFDWSLFEDPALIPSAPTEEGRVQKIIIHKHGIELHCLKQRGGSRFAGMYGADELPLHWLNDFERRLSSYLNHI